MKILLFTKKNLIVFFIIIFIIIISFFLVLAFYSHSPLAVEFTSNSEISDEFIDRIINLTKGEEKIAYLTFDDGLLLQLLQKF